MYQRPKRTRRGLSTLEMVLALPMLLFVMALILDIGTIAAWKVRGLSAARYMVWGSRWPRTANSDPRPKYWPEPATVGVSGGAPITTMDDSRVNLPVARGPSLSGARVNEDLLDPSRGLMEGNAHISRELPLLPRMLTYHLEAHNWLIDNKWQYQRTGLSSNYSLRIPVIYELAKAPAALSQTYVQAVGAIVRAPFREDLYPLYRDDEFIAYSARFPGISGPRNFYPGLRGFCDLNKEAVQILVDDLVNRIQGSEDPHVRGVPENLTRAFIGLYEAVIDRLEAQLNTTPPPANAGSIRAEIAQLRAKIAILNQFLTLLENRQDS